MGKRMLDILMHGVCTRNYKQVIPQMAETARVWRSAVSRAAIEPSEAEVQALPSRHSDDLKLLVICPANTRGIAQTWSPTETFAHLPKECSTKP